MGREGVIRADMGLLELTMPFLNPQSNSWLSGAGTFQSRKTWRAGGQMVAELVNHGEVHSKNIQYAVVDTLRKDIRRRAISLDFSADRA